MKINEILEDYDYSKICSTYSTSFEIIAKGEKNLIIKICKNVDGLSKEIFEDLKNLSSFLNFESIIVAEKTSRKKLSKAIYFRKSISVIPFEYFEDFLLGNLKIFYSYGKFLVKIDFEKMRKRRKEIGLSIKKLSEITNISKKTLYKIENGEVNPTIQNAKKLEEVLKIKLIKNLENNFERKEEYFFEKTSFIKGIDKVSEKLIVPKKEGLEEAEKLSKFLNLKII
ncbi:MAG: helix-turn-helix domain-containing protein [Candidatus Aenigmatarchaeota archaeon]